VDFANGVSSFLSSTPTLFHAGIIYPQGPKNSYKTFDEHQAKKRKKKELLGLESLNIIDGHFLFKPPPEP
jgi:hypothetical protein